MKKVMMVVATLMLMSMVVFTQGCIKSDQDSHGHVFIDLGLPSGTLWAKCNMGADTPEEYGYYFAWGETLPRDTFSRSNYRFCDASDEMLTKYCQIKTWTHNFITDTLTVLLPEDDAATFGWGSDWCIPTKEQWMELKENTESSWVTQNGVTGYLFTASNGKTLFLPAAGHRTENGLEEAGERGYYWSSELYSQHPIESYEYTFHKVFYGVGQDPRYYGECVRAVRSAR